MPLKVLDGSQSGLTQNDILQVICDDWGYNPGSQRIQNMVFRRINRVLRELHRKIQKWKLLRVYNAEVILQEGISEYDVKAPILDGGWGWDDCVEVLSVTIPGWDSRPLERLHLPQFRERSESPSPGISSALIMVDPRRVIIHPTPSMAAIGVGDYLCELPSLVSGGAQIEWPRHLDEVLLLGTEYYTARARLREDPRGVREYRDHYYSAIADIEEWDKNSEVRPNPARMTRAMRSKRMIAHDRATDVGWGR